MPSPKRAAIRKRALDPETDPVPQVAATRTISRAYGRAVAGFTLVAVLLAGVILMVTGSRATVTIEPKVTLRAVPFTLAIAAGESSSTDSLPGRLLELATSTAETVTVASAAPATDPNARAGGEVTITNSSGVPQQLVATTRLQTADGKIFRLQRTITVPANGNVSASVLADEPGGAYAIGPSSFTIPGLNPTRQQQVTAASSAQFTQAAGGDGISEEQLAEAQSRALAAIGARLSPLLQASLFDNETLNGQAVTTTPLELRASAQAGDSATSITFSGTVRVSATLFNDQELRRRAAASAGAGADPSTVTYTVQRAATGSGSIATVAGTVTVASGQVEVQAADLTGRTKAEAQVYLQLLPGVASAEVTLRPRWFTRLPQDPSRITVTISQPATEGR
jgi:hypothetical protein